MVTKVFTLTPLNLSTDTLERLSATWRNGYIGRVIRKPIPFDAMVACRQVDLHAGALSTSPVIAASWALYGIGWALADYMLEHRSRLKRLRQILMGGVICVGRAGPE